MKRDINFIDLHHGKHFCYQNRVFKPLKLKDKKCAIGARLSFNDIITHNFRLEKQLIKQELLVMAELKMYDEIGLDPTKEHKISYQIKKASIGDLKLVESFAIDKLAIEQKYKNSFSSVKHIDFIALPFLAFETLYTNEILDKRNDLFIIIDEQEAFSSFYKEGEHINSKKALCLEDMIKELKSLNIKIDIKTLKSILLQKGLNKDNYELHEYDLYDYIYKIFENFFSKTHNIALHNRNVYGLSQVDRIFFSLDNQLIPGLENIATSFFTDVTCKALDFFSHEDINELDAICASYIQDKISIEEDQYNFTIFKKKTPFYKTEIGKFALTATASMILLSSYPIYQQFQINSINEKNSILKDQLQSLSKNSKNLRKRYQEIKKEIQIAKNEQRKIDKEFHKLKNIANSLLALKSKKSKYTPMFLTVNQLLKKYKLSIENIKQVDNGAINFEISSVEDKRDAIAKFMTDLLNKGYTSVTSNEIKLNSLAYKSVITVKR